MTEYGRGQGPEPWHPDDPLYGDGGWGGQQAAQQAQQSQQSYGGQQQHYPQQPQQQYGDWGTGEQHGYGDQPYPQYDQYGQQYAPQQHQQPQHPQHQAPQQHQQQYDQNGWPTGSYPQDPYAGGPQDPYAQQPASYGGEQSDHYGTAEAYPPPEPPGRRRPEPEREPEPQTDWDPGPDQGEHAFFAGGDDEDGRDGEPDDRRGRGERRGGGDRRGGGKEKKRRSGLACLVVVAVLGGGLAGVSYFGYQFYQDRFGSAPDFAGSGNGEQVTVTIPKGSGGYAIGQVLKKMGVVKSVDAFVAAQAANPDGKNIQDGVYTLQKEMSAASAVELMLSPESRDNLIIAEGKRNAAVYELIDARLEVKKGTTAKVAETKWKTLGLPDWAVNHPDVKDPLEGFLFPSSYAVAKGQKPEDVLKQMVARATEKYESLDFETKAKSLGLEGPWELVTVASLVQAEGKTHDDFRKMSEVIYNRLKPTNTETNQKLQFDSSFNYLKGQSEIDISESEINSNTDPYNTYTNKGLPPGPIGNPGDDAVKAALDPTSDGWIYFVATDGMDKTEFARNIEEHQKLVDKFNASRKN
ncbi:endolytic transglycosylase MltG [Actinospica acidiphila]|uniref:endolytic transglycosylase MltG n=1 Tax=Streptomyces TaxID=1883 RepID=UPI0013D09E8F|nr:endolytic transglycosylase MltG [Streptomyces sp. E1N211]NEA78998.1 endolytic transglycosylase MltG [Actinospica acidiphila]